jgi:hypothetical protein
VALLLSNADVVMLTETWLRPGELCAIELLVKSHPLLCRDSYDVFATSAMEADAGNFVGRPYGGMATIVRRSQLFSAQETEPVCDRIQRIAIRDINNVMCHLLCNVYMPYFDTHNFDQC